MGEDGSCEEVRRTGLTVLCWSARMVPEVQVSDDSSRSEIEVLFDDLNLGEFNWEFIQIGKSGGDINYYVLFQVESSNFFNYKNFVNYKERGVQQFL